MKWLVTYGIVVEADDEEGAIRVAHDENEVDVEVTSVEPYED